MKLLKNTNKFVIIFFLLYFLLGTMIFKKYGISWDEPYQRQIGYVSLEYIRGDDSLLEFTDRYYGVVYELPLVIIEKALNLTDTQEIYYLRHYINFLLFYFGTVVFYLLNKKLFKSWKLALLACVLLITNPRIFADSFYNSKDIPLLVFYLLSIFTLFNYRTKKTKLNLSLHIVTSAVVISTRIIGGIIPAITVLLSLLRDKKNKFKNIFIYSLGTTILTYAFWPVLWKNPLNIFNAVKAMANFSYQDNLPTLYFGKFISTFSLPWHYLPTWIGITIPITFSILFLFGIYVAIKEFKEGNRQKTEENIILFTLIFTPLLSAILLKSTLYDGWRHFYFIYPLMVIFMIKGLKKISKYFIPLFVIEVIATIIFMIFNHPYQHLYFNIFFQRDFQETKQSFEMDYWGLSYREALEYVVEHDSSEKIKLVVANNPGNSNALILNKEKRERLEFLPEDNIDSADYYISNYRWHPSSYSYDNEVFSKSIMGAKIISVYKLTE